MVCAEAGMLPFPDHVIDVVVCTEVLEHLTEPGAAIDELTRVCARRCVVSVPWEPWFRLGNLGRGKNLRRLGDDPEHVNPLHSSAVGPGPGRLVRDGRSRSIIPVARR